MVMVKQHMQEYKVKVKKNTKVIGRKIKCMAMANIHLLLGLFIKDNGTKVK